MKLWTFFETKRTNFASYEQNLKTRTFSVKMNKICKMQTFLKKKKKSEKENENEKKRKSEKKETSKENKQ